MNPGPVRKLKTTRGTINSDSADHRQNTKIQKHLYLKFITTLTPSVNKTVNLNGCK